MLLFLEKPIIIRMIKNILKYFINLSDLTNFASISSLTDFWLLTEICHPQVYRVFALVLVTSANVILPLTPSFGFIDPRSTFAAELLVTRSSARVSCVPKPDGSLRYYEAMSRND